MKLTALKLSIVAAALATTFNLSAETRVTIRDFVDANTNKQGLKVVNPSTSSEIIYNGQSSLIISANTPEDGERPWIIDSNNQAFMPSGEFVREPRDFTKLGNKMFFVGDSPNHGVELFTVVGDEIQLVENIRSGGLSSHPEQLTTFGDYVLFVANDGDGKEIWRTNGTTTEKVTSLWDGDTVNDLSNLTQFGKWIYFTADTALEGNELYRTNGTEVIKHTDIGANQADGVQPDSELIVYNDRLFLSAFFIDQTGFEMHFIENDHGGLSLFAELVPGAGSTTIIDSMVGDDGDLYFVIDNAGQDELWHFNGNNNPSKKVDGGEMKLLAAFDGGLYFSSDDVIGANGNELYRFASGTLAQVNGVDGEPFELNSGSSGSNPHDAIVFDNTLYFVAKATAYGEELLKIEAGSFQAAIAFEDVPGTLLSNTFVANATQDKLYLTTTLNNRLVELDTNEMTVTDVTPSQQTGVDSMLNNFGNGLMFEYQNKLYFTGYTEEHGSELWVSDGETEQMVMDIYPGKTSSFPQEFIIYQDNLYFVASSATGGREVWKTDGQTVEQAFEIIQGADSSNPSYLTIHNDWLFFRAENLANGAELFATNGTELELIADINPGAEPSNPSNLTSFNGSLWLSARAGADSFELWELDEFLVLTKHEIGPGNLGSRPSDFYVTENYMYFTAKDGNGVEMWKVDSQGGVSMTKDINPGAASSLPRQYAEDQNGRVFFIANNGVNRRLYRAFEGTVVEANASPEGDFTSIAAAEGRIYATIDNPNTGNELYGRVGNDFSLLDESINGTSSNLAFIFPTHDTLLGVGLDSRAYVLDIINHAEAEWSIISHENSEKVNLFPPDLMVRGYDYGKNFVVPGCNNKLGCELFSVYFNEKPVAAIEGPTEAHSGVEINLSGLSSQDSDGEVVAYSWGRVSGPIVTLPNNNLGTTSFKAPNLVGEEDLVVRLRVTDNDGDEHMIQHTIKIFNSAPVAIINVSNNNPESGQLVTLDGSASTDDTMVSSYQWTQISGPAVDLGNANSSVASFPAIDVESDTLVEFQLVVTDENGISHSQTVGVVIAPKQPENQAPTAVVSVSNLSPVSGSLVTLNGSASSDSDGSITSYEWMQLDGVAVSLENNSQSVTSFIAPEVTQPTIVTIQLSVVDDSESSSQASVQIQIMPADANNAAPNAVIQVSNESPDTGEQVTLDASASSDSDGSIVSFAWTQVAGPTVSISGDMSNVASFVAPEVEEATQLQFLLTITDDQGAVVVSSVLINLQASVANVLPTVNVSVSESSPVSNTQVQLVGDTSVDTDGQIVSYEWSLVEGPNVEIVNATSANASFIAPVVSQSTTMTFRLTVTDNDGAQVAETISVTVVPASTPSPTNPTTGLNGGGGGSTGWLMLLALMALGMGRRRF